MKTNSTIVVLVTAKNKTEARKIAGELLKDKLIACANLVEGVESWFTWQGKTDHSTETLMMLKTQQRLFKKLVAKVQKLHSYQTPEIIALPIVEGSGDYLQWIDDVVTKE
ncbi:MAG: divalent-cation tolerance protein CutA [Candidatus Omnitrophica bacterium]|nr:divalent-cation tolerance protein CutA [Candidatus Omnitrophota bacterium]